jgi:hypothetical protein
MGIKGIFSNFLFENDMEYDFKTYLKIIRYSESNEL